MQLSQATQGHCCVSFLRLQQLHGKAVSCDQSGFDLQLEDTKQFKKDRKDQTVHCDPFAEQCVTVLATVIAQMRYINCHCGNEYVSLKAHVATSLTVVLEIFESTRQHI